MSRQELTSVRADFHVMDTDEEDLDDIAKQEMFMVDRDPSMQRKYGVELLDFCKSLIVSFMNAARKEPCLFSDFLFWQSSSDVAVV